MEQNIKDRDFSSEIEYKTSRSSGKGGQSVNKVSTKVELRFDVDESDLLSDEEKELINKNLQNRISKTGILIMTSDSERTQLANKKIVNERFYELLAEACQIPETRIPTKPSRSSKERRISDKKYTSVKKRKRRVDRDDID